MLLCTTGKKYGIFWICIPSDAQTPMYYHGCMIQLKWFIFTCLSYSSWSFKCHAQFSNRVASLYITVYCNTDLAIIFPLYFLYIISTTWFCCHGANLPSLSPICTYLNYLICDITLNSILPSTQLIILNLLPWQPHAARGSWGLDCQCSNFSIKLHTM